ncbi:YlbL family protein [Paenibacillus arenilitoris]|uniref:endopeptidase La n=1 Tax=Paenibacillus arenilitoris TaxID=2772299 RepID=A0A927CRM6_9BACL|nr:S16 family serine protease [Paenibacillus arenilitoris]MBD2872337.1 PDZ domain-containing protein [Paenibacillus arenilitoris]
MTRRNNARRLKLAVSILLSLGLIAAAVLIPFPYYLYQPGTVEKLSDYVLVENGKPSANDSFNLTTVYSIKVNNALTLLYGLISKDTEIHRADQIRGALTDGEYLSLLKHMMGSSQNNAMSAALRAAGMPAQAVYTGVFVRSLAEGSKAAGVIAPGDVIVEADGKPVTRLSELSELIGDGRRVPLTVELSESVAADGKGTTMPRIGIVTEDQYTIETPVKIEYAASDIGSPSAGFMFALEILDQLTDGELTRGKFVAGTGTIDAEGNVGQIGGIRDKLIAAERAGVELFFCPADVKASDRNEKDIRDEAKRRGDDITIVPVRTPAEAAAYLERLEG